MHPLLLHTHTQEQAPLARRGLRFVPARRSVVFLEESVCPNVVVGAEVGADAVAQFGDGSAFQVQRRRAGLCLVMVTGSAEEVWIFCVQEVLSKIWVQIHEAPELVCGTPQEGARDRETVRKALGRPRLRKSPMAYICSEEQVDMENSLHSLTECDFPSVASINGVKEAGHAEMCHA